MNEHVENPLKFTIIYNVENENFLIQDNSRVNNCCRLVYNEKKFCNIKEDNLQ